jgi:hypothetical protein
VIAVDALDEVVEEVLLGHQRIDQHEGARRVVGDAADLLGPVGRAARLRVRLVGGVGRCPAVEAGTDLSELHRQSQKLCSTASQASSEAITLRPIGSTAGSSTSAVVTA